VPRLSGEPLSSKVYMLLGCAVHVLLCHMVRRPRRVRRLIAAGVRAVVQWVRLSVRQCSGCVLAQREGCGTAGIQYGRVLSARWQ